jgi:single-strand DNA-binding protein
VRVPGLIKVTQDYLKKGMSVYVEGRLRNRQYEVSGEKKYITEVHIEELTILTPKSTNGATSAPQSQSQSAPTPVSTSAPVGAPVEDDLPF